MSDKKSIANKFG